MTVRVDMKALIAMQDRKPSFAVTNHDFRFVVTYVSPTNGTEIAIAGFLVPSDALKYARAEARCWDGVSVVDTETSVRTLIEREP